MPVVFLTCLQLVHCSQCFWRHVNAHACWHELSCEVKQESNPRLFSFLCTCTRYWPSSFDSDQTHSRSAAEFAPEAGSKYSRLGAMAQSADGSGPKYIETKTNVFVATLVCTALSHCSTAVEFLAGKLAENHISPQSHITQGGKFAFQIGTRMCALYKQVVDM